MSLAIYDQDLGLELFKIDNDFYILESDLTKSIEASSKAINLQRRRNPEIYLENKHFIKVTIRNHGKKRILWSPRGVSRLLMRMNTPLAIEFQDKLEDLVEKLRSNEIQIFTRDDKILLMKQISKQIESNRELKKSNQELSEKMNLISDKISQTGIISEQEKFRIKTMVTFIVKRRSKLEGIPTNKLFPRIWDELNKRVQVTSYKEIPRDRVYHAIDYLDGCIAAIYKLEEKKKQHKGTRSY